jgi:hypothetical protein
MAKTRSVYDFIESFIQILPEKSEFSDFREKL